jgi:chemotaxis protein methyltransferase CheR
MGDRMTRTAAQATIAPFGDPAFEMLKARIIARTGHDYYREKDDQLWEKIAPRLRATGCDTAADYLALIEDRDAREWPLLESAITINETFFFRFAEQFAALRANILPALIRARAETRRIRIWSVGCSTGAEPYSLAILIDELLGHRLPEWRVTITGTDIDEDALQTARSGLFGPWALRTLDPAQRARFFTSEGDRYRLLPRYRGMVRFERHNLMTLADGTTPLQFSDYDLILCRNVLIYFDIGVAMRVVAGLVERLAPDGWLLVGHAEPSPAFESVAAAREVAGIMAYRRLDEVAEVQEKAAEEPPAPLTPARRRELTRPRAATALARRARDAAGEAGTAKAPRSESGLDAVREALAIGDVSEAARLADGEAALRPGDPVPHYLGALGALALGEATRAEQGLRRALYLDRDFAMAHYLLGRHLIAIGREDDGRRSLANAARIAVVLDDEDALPEGDGMTAGALAAAVRSVIGS